MSLNMSKSNVRPREETLASIPVADQANQHDDEWRDIPENMRIAIMNIITRRA